MVVEWREASESDVGRVARFRDRKGDDWTYGMLEKVDAQECVYSCVSMENYPAELFIFCEVQEVSEQSKGVIDKRFNRFWCPDVCPITLLPFFMWIEHPEFGWVPTYGGPYDSYTIPEPEDGKCKNRFDVEYIRYRFDHDEGGWLIDEVESMTERVIHEETLIELKAWPDEV